MPTNDSPADTVRVAVIGAGYWGRNLVRVMGDLGALAAVIDSAVEPGSLPDIDVPVLGDDQLDVVLGDPRITAVMIATPATTHAAVARRCLEAGKHCFVEKPLTVDVAEAQDLVAAAAERGLVLMVGHLMQYHPVFEKLKAMVAEGALGQLQYIYSNRLNLGRFRHEENALWSFAPHDISMILALVGEEPQRVSAVGSSHLRKDVLDVTTTYLTFSGGVRAHVFVSWLHPVKEQRLVVVGEGGMAVFDDREPWASKLQYYRSAVEWQDGTPLAVPAEGQPVEVRSSEPLTLECQHFLEVVASGARPLTDGDEAIRVLRVLEAAQLSLDHGGLPATPNDGSATEEGTRIHPTAHIDENVTIGARATIWHFSHVLGGSTIGEGCMLGQNVVVGPNVDIGDGCRIQNNVSVYEGVTLADEVFCGPSVVFTNVTNPRAGVSRRDEFRPTNVGKGATLGANATIVCGHDIGEYAFIAAGAVVTKDVRPHALMIGAPARQAGWVSHEGERLDEALVCPRTGRRYREANGRLEELPAEGAGA